MLNINNLRRLYFSRLGRGTEELPRDLVQNKDSTTRNMKMDKFVSVEAGIRDALPTCPICTEHFHKAKRIPRQLSCCYNAVCQPCLKGIFEQNHLPCPICRHNHILPEGVESLPKESQVLGILDNIKKHKTPKIHCSYCPQTKYATAKCTNCDVYLCKSCLQGHPSTHKTTTFEEMNVLFSALKSKDGAELIAKLDSIKERIDTLSTVKKDIEESTALAINQIDSMFAKIAEDLQHRRDILLTQVTSTADEEIDCIKKSVKSYTTLQRRLQNVTIGRQSSVSVRAMLKESAQDVQYDRRGLIFTPVKVAHLTSIIESAGLVQTVTYKQASKPHCMEEEGHCNTMAIEPVDSPQEADKTVELISVTEDRKMWISRSMPDKLIITKKGEAVSVIICPHLKIDRNTASRDLVILDEVPIPGCRMQSPRTVLLYPPINAQAGTLTMYQVRCSFQMLQTIPVQRVIFMAASVDRPVDMCMGQKEGFHVGVGTYMLHFKDSICFYAMHNNKLQFCQKLSGNERDEMGFINLYIIMNKDKQQIHVVDVTAGKVLTTIRDVKLDCPLWTMMYRGRPEWTNISWEILTGNSVEVSQDMCELLATL